MRIGARTPTLELDGKSGKSSTEEPATGLAERALSALRQSGLTQAEGSAELSDGQRLRLAQTLGVAPEAAPTNLVEALSALVADSDLDGVPDLDLQTLADLGIAHRDVDHVSSQPDPLERAAAQFGLRMEVQGVSIETHRVQRVIAFGVAEGAAEELQQAARALDELQMALQVIDRVRARDGDYTPILDTARFLSGNLEQSQSEWLRWAVSFGVSEGVTTLAGGDGHTSTVMSHAARLLGSGPSARLAGSYAVGYLDASYSLGLTEMVNRSVGPIIEGIRILGDNAGTLEQIEFRKFVLEALTGSGVPEADRTAVAGLLERAGSVKGLDAIGRQRVQDVEVRSRYYVDALDSLQSLVR